MFEASAPPLFKVLMPSSRATRSTASRSAWLGDRAPGPEPDGGTRAAAAAATRRRRRPEVECARTSASSSSLKSLVGRLAESPARSGVAGSDASRSAPASASGPAAAALDDVGEGGGRRPLT